MRAQGATKPRGDLGLRVISADGSAREPVRPVAARGVVHPRLRDVLREVWRDGLPHRGLGREVNFWRVRNLRHLWRGLRRVVLARALRLPHFYGVLRLRIFRADGSIVDLGLASMRVVTTAGVNLLVDAMQDATTGSGALVDDFRYHAIGTGVNAEASSDVALQTEITTAYSPDNTRATGTRTEGASANIYRTVGTVTVDSSVAATEHGVLTQAATGGGTLLDRSVFTVVNLASGDGLEGTYDLTIAAGG